jgi:hypothetical protein
MNTNSNLTPDPSPSPDPQPKKRKGKPNAFADVLRAWESMLNAVADHPAELATVEPHRAALATSLDKAKQAKNLQESHGAGKQATTQSLQEIVVEGKDQAIRLRNAIRAELGPTTELLTQFGMRPLRRRPLRHKTTPTDTPTPPPAPAPQPEVQAGKGVMEKE